MKNAKKKISLPDVTLLAATSVDIDQTQISLKISSQNIKFGAVKLLSSLTPSKKYPDIEYVSIPHMDFLGYSRLIIKDLQKYGPTVVSFNVGDFRLLDFRRLEVCHPTPVTRTSNSCNSSSL